MAKRSRAAARSDYLTHSVKKSPALKIALPAVGDDAVALLSAIQNHSAGLSDCAFALKYLDSVSESAVAAMVEAGHALKEPFDPKLLADLRLKMPENSKEYLACTILWRATTFRIDLDGERLSGWRAAAEAIRLAELARAFELEWLMAPVIYPGLTQLAARVKGGIAKAADERDQKAIARREWQIAADKVWQKHPRYSAERVATVIAPKFNAAANTIRLKIKKPDGLLTTPSK